MTSNFSDPAQATRQFFPFFFSISPSHPYAYTYIYIWYSTCRHCETADRHGFIATLTRSDASDRSKPRPTYFQHFHLSAPVLSLSLIVDLQPRTSATLSRQISKWLSRADQPCPYTHRDRLDSPISIETFHHPRVFFPSSDGFTSRAIHPARKYTYSRIWKGNCYLVPFEFQPLEKEKEISAR